MGFLSSSLLSSKHLESILIHYHESILIHHHEAMKFASTHCIDVMHVEKNMCDSAIGMLLNILGKIKGGLNTCQDLADMSIRE